MSQVSPRSSNAQLPTACWVLRTDLLLQKASDESMLVIDPVRETYYQLGPLELALIQYCDGQTSVRQIMQQMIPQLELLGESVQRLTEALIRLVNAQLLVRADSTGPVSYRKTRLSPLSILSITLWKTRRTEWFEHVCDRLTFLMHPVITTLSLLTLLIAVLVGGFNAGVIAEELLQAGDVLNLQLGLQMALGLMVFKVLHETGHGIAARHFGIPIREVGLKLLVFAPCAYCDLTDSWRLSSRKRLMISLAGISSDLFWASLILIWGLNSYLPQTRLLCFSLSTLLVLGTLALNGNPLLRFDGYYALSDLTGVQNLAARAMSCLNDVLQHPARVFQLSVSQWGLLIYGLTSFCYRIVLLVLICWMISNWFEVLNLQALFVISLCVWASVSLGTSARKMLQASEKSCFRSLNAGQWIAILMLTGGLFWPLSATQYHTAMLTFRDGQTIRVPFAGRVLSAIQVSQQVQPGESLLVLTSPDWLLKQSDARAKHQSSELRFAAAEAIRFSSPELPIDQASHRSQVKLAKDVIQTINQTLSQLQQTASFAGEYVVLPNARSLVQDHDRKSVIGSALLAEPLIPGEWIDRGSEVGRIVNRQQMQAMIEVDATDLPQFQLGQQLSVMTSMTDAVMLATVSAIETTLATSHSSATSERFGVTVDLDLPFEGIEGTECIVAVKQPPQSIISRVVTWLMQAWGYQLAG